jgi:hypothetical protein
MSKRIVWLLVAVLLLPQLSWAHHGWGWATDEEFEISGRIVEVRLGYPHGEVDIQVGEERWVAEVGQPYRHADAGLADSLLALGAWITVHGHRSARAAERLIKAERVVIGKQG